MASIIINGTAYKGDGLVISNGRGVIEGCLVVSGLTGIVEVRVEGTLQNFATDAAVTINGSVLGDVRAGGSVHCGNVGGNVTTGGDASCGPVEGAVVAGGDITYS